MPLERGGRADKMGNRYEVRCIIYEMLKVLREVNYSIVIEALGDDEVGTDILITNFEGQKEHQQCKVRNASKICQETKGKIDYDKGFIRLPRQQVAFRKKCRKIKGFGSLREDFYTGFIPRN